jgi:hypothetical protein
MMKKTYQFENQSVYEHGISVYEYFKRIKTILQGGENELNIPQIFIDNKDNILPYIDNDYIIKEYSIWHDCGKPFCIEYDENGKKHFPNHAQVSYDTFKKISDNEFVADLILHDMDVHIIKADGFDEWVSKLSKTQVIIHFIVGLAELYSNCQMFGGQESTSFKIKLKSLVQRFKQYGNQNN